MGARGLLRALVEPAGNSTRHLLTIGTADTTMSTAIDVDATGALDVELPHVLRKLGALLGAGTQLSLVLRTFGNEVAFTAENGTPIPVKTVRCWLVAQGIAHPQTEAATFAASCTDADTGELLPPERGVEYADAWPVPLT